MSKKTGRKVCGNCKRCFLTRVVVESVLSYSDPKGTGKCNLFSGECCNEKSNHFRHYLHPSHSACPEFQVKEEG